MPRFGKNIWLPSWFLGGGAIFPILSNVAPLSLSVSLSLCVITVNFQTVYSHGQVSGKKSLQKLVAPFIVLGGRPKFTIKSHLQRLAISGSYL